MHAVTPDPQLVTTGRNPSMPASSQALPHLRHGAKGPVSLKQISVGQVAGSRNMAASHARPRLSTAPVKRPAARASSTCSRAVDILPKMSPTPRNRIARKSGRNSAGAGDGGCPDADGPTFVKPFWQTAIEHRGGVVPEQTHQPPSARRRRQALLIIEHYARLIIDAERPEKLGEAAWSRDHMRQVGSRSATWSMSKYRPPGT